MEYRIEFGADAESDATVTTSGAASAEGLIGFVLELIADPRFRPGMAVLVDHSALDSRPLEPEDIQSLSRAVLQRDRLIGPSRVAIVVPDSLTFGYARMYELYADDAQLCSRVFYSRAEAVSWLVAEASRTPS
jgi:hypothetical protein